MPRKPSILLALATLLVAQTVLPATSASCPTLKHIVRRSDSQHKLRQMVGIVPYTHRYDMDAWYGTLSIMPIYSSTLRPNEITRCIFGESLCKDACSDRQMIRVQGSKVAGREKNAWVADYFYLPPTHDGIVTFEPRVQTFCCNFDIYLGLDKCWQGTYFRLHAPLAHSRWNMNLCEKLLPVTDPRTHEPGYFTQNFYEIEKLVQLFGNYAEGAIPSSSEGNFVTWNRLQYAKIDRCTRKETGLADLRLELGKNLINAEDHHLGIYLQVAAPTGTRNQPCYLFDARVGNGKHWEAGGGLSAHWRSWQDADGESDVTFSIDVSATHLCKRSECRTFDLACKPNSAYMLAAKFGPNSVRTGEAIDAADGQIGGGLNNPDPGDKDDAAIMATVINRQFAEEYAPVANLSTLKVDVSVGAQVDMVAMMTYRCQETTLDIGYNFWARSCEKISCACDENLGGLCDRKNKDTWALKGDARMYGFQGVPEASGQLPPDEAFIGVPLSATQSKATICNGTNNIPPDKIGFASIDTNPGIDNPTYAYTMTPEDNANQVAPLSLLLVDRDGNYPSFDVAGSIAGEYYALTDIGWQVQTSKTPVFLSCDDISMPRIRSHSHTIFAHLSRTCDLRDCRSFLGAGASVEFGRSCNHPCCSDGCVDPCCCNSGCNCCGDKFCDACCELNRGPSALCTMSQWSVWLKFGLIFS